jgi:hypothetical protein
MPKPSSVHISTSLSSAGKEILMHASSPKALEPWLAQAFQKIQAKIR